jgi:hypothetical protein
MCNSYELRPASETAKSYNNKKLLNFFLVLFCFGCGIRDPRYRMEKNTDPRSEINILDPQHCSSQCLAST